MGKEHAHKSNKKPKRSRAGKSQRQVSMPTADSDSDTQQDFVSENDKQNFVEDILRLQAEMEQNEFRRPEAKRYCLNTTPNLESFNHINAPYNCEEKIKTIKKQMKGAFTIHRPAEYSTAGEQESSTPPKQCKMDTYINNSDILPFNHTIRVPNKDANFAVDASAGHIETCANKVMKQIRFQNFPQNDIDVATETMVKLPTTEETKYPRKQVLLNKIFSSRAQKASEMYELDKNRYTASNQNCTSSNTSKQQIVNNINKTRRESISHINESNKNLHLNPVKNKQKCATIQKKVQKIPVETLPQNINKLVDKDSTLNSLQISIFPSSDDISLCDNVEKNDMKELNRKLAIIQAFRKITIAKQMLTSNIKLIHDLSIADPSSPSLDFSHIPGAAEIVAELSALTSEQSINCGTELCAQVNLLSTLNKTQMTHNSPKHGNNNHDIRQCPAKESPNNIEYDHMDHSDMKLYDPQPKLQNIIPTIRSKLENKLRNNNGMNQVANQTEIPSSTTKTYNHKHFASSSSPRPDCSDDQHVTLSEQHSAHPVYQAEKYSYMNNKIPNTNYSSDSTNEDVTQSSHINQVCDVTCRPTKSPESNGLIEKPSRRISNCLAPSMPIIDELFESDPPNEVTIPNRHLKKDGSKGRFPKYYQPYSKNLTNIFNTIPVIANDELKCLDTNFDYMKRSKITRPDKTEKKVGSNLNPSKQLPMFSTQTNIFDTGPTVPKLAKLSTSYNKRERSATSTSTTTSALHPSANDIEKTLPFNVLATNMTLHSSINKSPNKATVTVSSQQSSPNHDTVRPKPNVKIISNIPWGPRTNNSPPVGNGVVANAENPSNAFFRSEWLNERLANQLLDCDALINTGIHDVNDSNYKLNEHVCLNNGNVPAQPLSPLLSSPADNQMVYESNRQAVKNVIFESKRLFDILVNHTASIEIEKTEVILTKKMKVMKLLSDKMRDLCNSLTFRENNNEKQIIVPPGALLFLPGIAAELDELQNLRKKMMQAAEEKDGHFNSSTEELRCSIAEVTTLLDIKRLAEQSSIPVNF